MTIDLTTRVYRLNDVLCASNALNWDARTMMPNGGAETRGHQIATLKGIAREMILDPEIDMVLCDELNIVLRYDYLDVAEVLETLKQKPEMKHVIITGRNAKEELIEFADLVTEREVIKHPFRSGVKAQIGVEY